jgi:hypothetical protein
MNTRERLKEIQQQARTLRTAAAAVLARFAGGEADGSVEGMAATLPISIKALDLGSSHDTVDFLDVSVAYPDGTWQFMMHDIGGDLRVLASGAEVAFFPYTLSGSVCAPAMLDRVLEKMTRTIALLMGQGFEPLVRR